MTAADPHIQIGATKRRVVLSTIMPGRRALGETWNRVDVYWDDEKRGFVTELTPTDAPAQNRAITVMNGMSSENEMVNFLLERKFQDQIEQAKNPRGPSIEEQTAWINKAWHDWCELKRAMYAGKSQFGAGGNFQREKVYHR